MILDDMWNYVLFDEEIGFDVIQKIEDLAHLATVNKLNRSFDDYFYSHNLERAFIEKIKNFI